MILAASPDPIAREGIAPAAIVSTTLNLAGFDSLADATSCARTA